MWIRNALVAAGVALMISGCAVAPGSPPGRRPVRWIIVEKQVADIIPEGRLGEGQVDPQATLLTMQPLYAEDVSWEVVVDPHDYFVEVLEITPSTQAAPGETVTAKVRVGKAKPDSRYRLLARPSTPEVQMIGRAEEVVYGGSPTLFRFTSTSSGRGGIAVGVEKLDGGD
jgi:hypothetical protein